MYVWLGWLLRGGPKRFMEDGALRVKLRRERTARSDWPFVRVALRECGARTVGRSRPRNRCFPRSGPHAWCGVRYRGRSIEPDIESRASEHTYSVGNWQDSDLFVGIPGRCHRA
jgi:hypothetical protein